jgi:SAM-dependent methyltransferase
LKSRSDAERFFGDNAAAYATSAPHAKGESLQLLLAATEPGAGWRVLDVATGAGHTALTFAPHVAHVVATDLTLQMLLQTRRLARERGRRLDLARHDAAALPFAAETFDLVTCRIAPHHFPAVGTFVREAVRVTKPAGLVAIVDNVVPGTHLRGKPRRRAEKAAAYINAFETLRDPSHVRALSAHEWERRLADAGTVIIHSSLSHKTMDFASWTDRTGIDDETRLRLRVMLQQAPEGAAAHLTPQIAGDRITFRLTEAIIVGKKSEN